MAMACLDNIIKLSRTECDCFGNNKPETYNEGLSEVYLDELEGLSLENISAAENCEEGGLWDMMARARENAIYQFNADLLACVEGNYKNKRSNFSGLIGDTAFNATSSISQDTAGLRIRPYEIVGGDMTLKSLRLMCNATGPLTRKG